MVSRCLHWHVCPGCWDGATLTALSLIACRCHCYRSIHTTVITPSIVYVAILSCTFLLMQGARPEVQDKDILASQQEYRKGVSSWNFDVQVRAVPLLMCAASCAAGV